MNFIPEEHEIVTLRVCLAQEPLEMRRHFGDGREGYFGATQATPWNIFRHDRLVP